VEADVEAERTYPYALSPFRGPLPEEFLERTLRSLGPQAHASRALFDAGFVPPDVLTAITLFLLTSQPRPKPDPTERPSSIAGGVWTQEQITYHRPMRIGEKIEIQGEIARRWARAGRRFSVTTSQTRDAQGRLLVSGCTTGLVQYRRDPDLADEEEGRPESDVVRPAPDAAAASANPSLEALRALRESDRIVGPSSEVSLQQMQAREGERALNPIHSDPEAARQAGLDAPIVGGGHVLAFLQEMLMQAWGPEALLHGAHFDVRWVSARPRGRVRRAHDAHPRRPRRRRRAGGAAGRKPGPPPRPVPRR
jgi:acyl dehydratase